MTELLERAAQQQTLLDAWHDVRVKAQQEGRYGGEHQALERRAAERLAAISRGLLDATWRPAPVRPVTVPKPTGGERRLGVPPLEDRIVERAILGVIDPLIDGELLPWSFAYRRGLGVQDAIRCLLQARDNGHRWVARGDFRECFDEIPREPVMQRLRELLVDDALVELIRLLVWRPVQGADGTTTTGLHQGSALSPVLANLYLDRFDRAMLATDRITIRYGDDFAVPATERMAAEAALAAAHRAAAQVGLSLGPGKCSVRGFDEGVPFLGQTLTTGTGTRERAIAHPRAKTVYVNERGGLLRSRGDRLRLERQGEPVFSIAFERVQQIVVFGNVVLTTPLLQHVLARGINTVLLSGTGRYFGRLQGASTTNPFTRHAQHRELADANRSLALAKRFVRGKIVNLRAGLLRGSRRGKAVEVLQLVERLGNARERVEQAETVEQLMGVEGAATRDYFTGFGRLLGPEWGFTARRRRPPPDPVNSLLSLGYTLLVQEAVTAAETVGLDPYAGYLHQMRVGRPSLALDLIEELRPVIVDSVVLRALHTGMLDQDDFDVDPGPPTSCLLTRQGRKPFLAAYERRMLTLLTHPGTGRRVPYRVAPILQARMLADELTGSGSVYEPLVWK